MKQVSKSLASIESKIRKMTMSELKSLSKKLSKVHSKVLIKILLLKKSSISVFVSLESALAFL